MFSQATRALPRVSSRFSRSYAPPVYLWAILWYNFNIVTHAVWYMHDLSMDANGLHHRLKVSELLFISDKMYLNEKIKNELNSNNFIS